MFVRGEADVSVPVRLPCSSRALEGLQLSFAAAHAASEAPRQDCWR